MGALSKGALAPVRRTVKSWIDRNPTIQHAYEHARAVARRGRLPQGDVPPIPKRVIVEPANGCNLSCAYCGNKDMVRPWTLMPMATAWRTRTSLKSGCGTCSTGFPSSS